MLSRIGLVLPLDKACFRQILEGIRDGLKRDHPGWQPILLSPDTATEADVRAAQLDGVIVAASARMLKDAPSDLGIPMAVFGSARDSGKAFARVAEVDFDHRATGRLAAEHLLGTGVDTFVFVGDEAEGSDIVGRRIGFETRLAEDGFVVQRFASADATWLGEVHIPCGVFTSTDTLGLELVFACKAMGLRMPHDIAVLSAGNDEGICRLATPSLSSVQFPTGRIGHVLVEQLARLIDGQRVEGETLFPPLEICQRGSTEMLALDDDVLVRSLRFIGNHFHEGIGVAAIANQCGVSRRGLERRFRSRLRRTVLEEINRRRVDEARILLKKTDDTMERVAELCGFSDSRRLAIHFRRIMRMSPSEYRREVTAVKA